MKYIKTAIICLSVIVSGGIIYSPVWAVVIGPQALDESGFPTIRPPALPSITEGAQASTNDQSANLILKKSLEMAGLPTIQPPATLTISENGEVKIKNAVIFQIAGKTVFARTYWQDTFIRWTIRIGDKTEVIKRFGGQAKINDIAVGHVVNIDGVLLSGAETLNLNANVIRDFSLENESGTFSGKVSQVDRNTGNVVLNTLDGSNVTLNFDSGVTIKKGAIYLQPTQINMGDKILSVSGSYNAVTKKMEASSVEIYQDQSIFTPRNFQGTIKNLSGTVLPVTFTLVTKDKEYNIYVPQAGSILRANRSATDLKRFVEGDTVRVYGAIRKTDLNTIDVEVLRNLNL